MGKDDIGVAWPRAAIFGNILTLANEIVRCADLLVLARGPHKQMIDPEGALSEDEIRAQIAANPSLVGTAVLGDALIGSPESVARQLAALAVETSVDGVCMSFIDFERDLELMARRGLEPLGNALADAGKSLVLTVTGSRSHRHIAQSEWSVQDPPS
jgi:alkanesulfonate monooxygenase SsuD/methylene tetrahydromethanopterin reductase-like flavin-dependent oxidoreductase (luciferase family)